MTKAIYQKNKLIKQMFDDLLIITDDVKASVAKHPFLRKVQKSFNDFIITVDVLLHRVLHKKK